MIHSDDYPIVKTMTNGAFMELQSKEKELEGKNLESAAILRRFNP